MINLLLNSFFEIFGATANNRSIRVVRFRLHLKFFIVCLAAAVLTFAACGTRRQSKRLSVQTSTRVEAAFYRQQCVICHGAEAEGKDIGGRVTPSMRDGDILTKSDEYIYDQIYNGGNGMPPFKHQMTEAQIKNMVRFIRDLQKENP